MKDLISRYIDNNKVRFLDELLDLIRIPSVGAKKEHYNDVIRAAQFLAKKLVEAGVDKAELLDTAGLPVVYAEKLISPGLPTVLVYGHYDVQPAEPFELWDSPPFDPQIRDGKIYGRGADDDKGQSYMHIKAFELLNRTGQLPCNVKFLLEGEEEIGSPNLNAFCEANKELLQSDIILISDTTMISMDIPSVTVGLRGIAYWEIELTGPNRDLHSGIYGGAVKNPINALCEIIASLTDGQNRITIPGFYDDVIELSPDERTTLKLAPFDEREYCTALAIDSACGEEGFTTLEHTGTRPSLDVNGIWGGYTEQGAKTVLPSKAYAKISARLVPNQQFERIQTLFTNHLQSIAPKGTRITIKQLHGGDGYLTPTDFPAYKAAEKAITTTFGSRPIPTRSGASIPIVADFEKTLGTKSILLGFGLKSDAIHSPNENYPLFNYYKGIETIAHFYQEYARIMTNEA